MRLLIIVIATFFAYSNIFQNEFVIDDASFIKTWPTIQSLGNIPQLLAGDVPPSHGGVYRPIRSVLYAFYYQLFGTNPFWWHLHSLVVHLAATVLVYFIVARILEVGGWKLDLEPLKSRILDVKKSKNQGQGYRTSIFKNSVPFVSSLLFGLHPIHTETITYIASSMDAIGIVFFFAAFLLYLQRHLVVSAIFAGLAFFTNEMTLTLPLLIALYEMTLGRIRNKELGIRGKNHNSLFLIHNSIPYFALVGFYAFVRVVVAGATTRGPYLADSFYLTMLTMTKVFIKYISLLILPINQANNHAIGKGIEAFVYRDYRTEAIAAQTIFDPQILFSLTVIIGLIVIAIFSFTRRPLVTFSIGWFFISLLPVSEIIPQGSMMNERMLYIPSFGFVLLVGVLFERSRELFSTRFAWSKNIALGIVVLVALSYSFLSYQRNKDWKDEITLWSKDVAVYPTENTYAYYQLGNALSLANRQDEAIKAWQTSNAINTKFVLGLGSIAILYSNAGMTDRAEEMYKKAIEINPSFWEGRFNLGNLYMQQEKRNPALEQYRAVLEINPNFLPAKQYVE